MAPTGSDLRNLPAMKRLYRLCTEQYTTFEHQCLLFESLEELLTGEHQELELDPEDIISDEAYDLLRLTQHRRSLVLSRRDWDDSEVLRVVKEYISIANLIRSKKREAQIYSEKSWKEILQCRPNKYGLLLKLCREILANIISLGLSGYSQELLLGEDGSLQNLEVCECYIDSVQESNHDSSSESSSQDDSMETDEDPEPPQTRAIFVRQCTLPDGTEHAIVMGYNSRYPCLVPMERITFGIKRRLHIRFFSPCVSNTGLLLTIWSNWTVESSSTMESSVPYFHTSHLESLQSSDFKLALKDDVHKRYRECITTYLHRLRGWSVREGLFHVITAPIPRAVFFFLSGFPKPQISYAHRALSYSLELEILQKCSIPIRKLASSYSDPLFGSTMERYAVELLMNILGRNSYEVISLIALNREPSGHSSFWDDNTELDSQWVLQSQLSLNAITSPSSRVRLTSDAGKLYPAAYFDVVKYTLPKEEFLKHESLTEPHKHVRCRCQGACTVGCPCKRQGIQLDKNSNPAGRLKYSSNCSDDNAYYKECSTAPDWCGCTNLCTNNYWSKIWKENKTMNLTLNEEGSEKDLFEIRNTEEKGWCVYTLNAIPKGYPLGNYVGELILDNPHYVSQNSYLFDIKGDLVYSSLKGGNWARVLSHRCKRFNLRAIKCVAHVFEENDVMYEKIPKIIFLSTRKIEKGEELSICYADEDNLAEILNGPCRCDDCKSGMQE